MRLQSSYFSAAVLAVLLTACGSTGPTRFYTLAGPVATATPQQQPAQSAASQRLLIEVLPVSVPERLARPQIVVRTDEARVDILEQDRWSAPLNNELRDALASGIANRLGAIDVTRSGRPANQPAYRIAVELRQLDAVRNGNVQAGFSWTITRTDDARSATCSLTLVEPVNGAGVDALILGMRKAVGNAVEAIAANVVRLQDGKSGGCST